MTKTLTKEILKLTKVPHPKGRKAAQLTKKAIRASGREKVKLAHQMKVNLTGEKFVWFRDNLADVDLYTPELVIDLIKRYLSRFDEELEQIQLKHSTGKRKGRQHANREDIIRMTIENERNEYETSGIEMPDILNPKQLNLLKNWSGELRFLQNFKIVRYNKTRLQSLLNSRKNLIVQVETKKNNNEEKIKENKMKEDNNLEEDAKNKEIKIHSTVGNEDRIREKNENMEVD